jgi:hypothetical protein
VTVNEGSHTATFRIVSAKIDMRSSRRVLEENETAEVTVRVSRLEGIPDAAWNTGPSERSGKLLLSIKNDSPDVVTMEGASGDTMTVVLGRDDIRNGVLEKKITVRALKARPCAFARLP